MATKGGQSPGVESRRRPGSSGAQAGRVTGGLTKGSLRPGGEVEAQRKQDGHKSAWQLLEMPDTGQARRVPRRDEECSGRFSLFLHVFGIFHNKNLKV